MNRRGAVALVAALAATGMLAACTPPSDPGSPPTTVDPLPEPPAEFTTLAYNVAGLPQEISKANPQQHIPLISPLLNEYDVVLTQEDFTEVVYQTMEALIAKPMYSTVAF
jgi:hypothetical protein